MFSRFNLPYLKTQDYTQHENNNRTKKIDVHAKKEDIFSITDNMDGNNLLNIVIKEDTHIYFVAVYRITNKRGKAKDYKAKHTTSGTKKEMRMFLRKAKHIKHLSKKQTINLLKSTDLEYK